MVYAKSANRTIATARSVYSLIIALQHDPSATTTQRRSISGSKTAAPRLVTSTMSELRALMREDDDTASTGSEDRTLRTGRRS